MTQRRNLIPALGFLMWSGIILAFDRHDLPFYGASFLFSLTLTLLALAQTAPQPIKVQDEDQLHD